MIPVFAHKLVSSFFLYLDHKILEKGSGFTNISANFYKLQSTISGSTIYTAPYKQLMNDFSISGATQITGVYVNNVFTPVGSGNITAINHAQGAVYFSSPPSNGAIISGDVSVKDFNLYLTNQLEYKLLFETKYFSNSRYSQQLSGLQLDSKTSPAIFLKVKDSESKPGYFGGGKDDTTEIRAIIITDNEYQKLGVCQIMRDLTQKPFNIVASTPFDYAGNYTGLSYNYNNLNFDTSVSPFVMGVKVKDIPLTDEYADAGKSFALVDFTLSCLKKPD